MIPARYPGAAAPVRRPPDRHTTTSRPQSGNFFVYRVQQGDTLTKTAEQFLSDGQRWKDIYAANRDQLGSDPNLIRPGQQLRIPM